MQIHSYLTFNGNCLEAMTFYQQCFGGKLSFQTVGDSPLASKLPKQMKNSILHAMLSNENLVLMASDMVQEAGLIQGNNIALSLSCNSEHEIKTCYEKLSAGGKANHPFEISFWGALFGDLTDKFGNHWILNFKQQ